MKRALLSDQLSWASYTPHTAAKQSTHAPSQANEDIKKTREMLLTDTLRVCSLLKKINGNLARFPTIFFKKKLWQTTIPRAKNMNTHVYFTSPWICFITRSTEYNIYMHAAEGWPASSLSVLS